MRFWTSNRENRWVSGRSRTAELADIAASGAPDSAGDDTTGWTMVDVWILLAAVVHGGVVGYGYMAWVGRQIDWDIILHLGNGVVLLLLALTFGPGAMWAVIGRSWKVSTAGLYVMAFYVGMILYAVAGQVGTATLAGQPTAGLVAHFGELGLVFWIGFKHALLVMVTVGIFRLDGVDLGRVSRRRGRPVPVPGPGVRHA